MIARGGKSVSCQDCEFDQLNINNVYIIKREILLYMCDKEKCLCDSIYLWKWGVLGFSTRCKVSAEKK